MRRPLMVLSAILCFAGCAAPPPQDGGTFGVHATPEVDRAIATDIAQKLATLYPPAKTRFSFVHPATDPFGGALVVAMRGKGYALEEFKNVPQSKPDGKGGPAQKTHRFAYILDQAVGEDMYRVTVTVNDQSLSRLYLAKSGDGAAAGAWTRKE